MFKQAFTIVSLGAFFFILCSMSNCKEDMTLGPLTTVHGKVTDVITGQGVPNISFQIKKDYSKPGYIDGGTGVSLYDTVSTQADGTYTLTFVPKGTGFFSLEYKDLGHNLAAYALTNYINIGADNTLDFKVYQSIRLGVNVHNTTDHGRKSFMFSYVSNAPYYYDSGYLMNFVTDKSFTYTVPHLSKITLISNFNNGYSATQYNILTDTLVFRQSFNTGSKDTTINITNL